MPKRPSVITLALAGKLKAVLEQSPMPDLSLGACIDMDTEIFFSDYVSTTARAKAICAQCPVAALCLNWANQNADYGVFGGLTAKERRAKYGEVATQDPVKVACEMNLILNGTLDSIANEYECDQRTALRWRKILKNYQLAA